MKSFFKWLGFQEKTPTTAQSYSNNSTITKNWYQGILENEKFKSEIYNSKKQFELKPFVNEFYKFKVFANILTPILSFFSIIAAFGFLHFQFANTLHTIAAAFFALVLLILLEVFKVELSLFTFKKIFQNSITAFNLALLLFVFCLYGLSVFTSVNGTLEIYKTLDKSEQSHKDTQAHKTDSLRKYYDSKILQEKKSLSSFKKSVEWNGKINITDTTVKNTLLNHNTQIASFEREKRKAIDLVNFEAKTVLKEIRADNGFNIKFWFSLALIVELLIFLSVWFKKWYQYNVSKESEIFGSGQVFQMNFDNLKTYANMILQNGQTQPQTPIIHNQNPILNENGLPYQSQTIGFNYSNGSSYKIPKQKNDSPEIPNITNIPNDSSYKITKESEKIDIYEKIRIMFYDNIPQRAVARELGISQSAVSKIENKLGLNRRMKGGSE